MKASDIVSANDTLSDNEECNSKSVNLSEDYLKVDLSDDYSKDLGELSNPEGIETSAETVPGSVPTVVDNDNDSNEINPIVVDNDSNEINSNFQQSNPICSINDLSICRNSGSFNKSFMNPLDQSNLDNDSDIEYMEPLFSDFPPVAYNILLRSN